MENKLELKVCFYYFILFNYDLVTTSGKTLFLQDALRLGDLIRASQTVLGGFGVSELL